MCHFWGKRYSLVADNKAEINSIICRSVMKYAFWDLIGFWYFQVFSFNWPSSYCQEIVINGLDIDFKMSWGV